MELAPIVLFVYNRPWHTRQTLEALSKNRLADKSKLYIYSDGQKSNASDEDIAKIQEVRGIIREQKWCDKVTIYESEYNKGLANSIITGVTEIVNKYGKIIVLENDIITSQGFLTYMNDALSFYENEERVYHISGYILPIEGKYPETFFYNTASCWGWGTWQRAWQEFNPDAKILASTIYEKGLIQKFNVNNAYNFYSQLEKNISGEYKTWAIKWYASFFLKNGFALHPGISLTNNIGHDLSGLHSGLTEKYNWHTLADKIEVKKIPIQENKKVLKAIKVFYTNRSIFFLNRLKHFIKIQLNSIGIISPTDSSFKNIAQNDFLKKTLHRELNRISALPRFKEDTFKFKSKKIIFFDSKSFIQNYTDIFIKEHLKFETQKSSPVILDLHADVGISILYFKKIFPSSKIFVFEPDKVLCEIAKKNIEISEFKDITLIENDVQSNGNGKKEIDSKIKNILGNNKIDLLKIDIEGAEFDILNECKDLLVNVERIFVIVHSYTNKKQDISNIIEIIEKSGFRHYISNNAIESKQPFFSYKQSFSIDNKLYIYCQKQNFSNSKIK